MAENTELAKRLGESASLVTSLAEQMDHSKRALIVAATGYRAATAQLRRTMAVATGLSPASSASVA